MDDDDEYRRKAKIAVVAMVVLASIAVFALFVAFAYYCYIRRKVSMRRQAQKAEDANLYEKSDFANLQVVAEKGLKVFTFKQLHSATGGFSKSNVIGHGGFGLVYRGVLSDGRKAAINSWSGWKAGGRRI
ncbi:proline-rich receptor-like protein kinase PERK15 [Arachis stenosperma]|uniref:proline-rich receptor-like protein kinase PERK15 n=1 Tax=Arachis stenosperma TaxID=217475 RepID=UPI0025AD227D|nr:proline-rich receptor-like protein kinase PERK15 [Arachis stenosperma]